jgi:hypothetical protein
VKHPHTLFASLAAVAAKIVFGRERAKKVLVISGPIASGKSTVARALADRFRSSHTAAVMDLDRVSMMLEDRPPMTDRSLSRQARRAAAALTDHFVLDGVELVIVEGISGRSPHRNEFTSRLTTPIQPVFVTLRVTVAEALRRVEWDSGRHRSQIPAILRASHAEFAMVPVITGDVTIYSTNITIDEIASILRATLEDVAPSVATGPLFRDVDCVQIPVHDIDAALEFYCRALGHALVWRTAGAPSRWLTPLLSWSSRPSDPSWRQTYWWHPVRPRQTGLSPPAER